MRIPLVICLESIHDVLETGERQMCGCTASRRYLGMHDGILVVLSDVVVDEDVLDMLVEGVHPQRLPPPDGEGITGPPEGEESHSKFTHGRHKTPIPPGLSECCAYHSKWSWKPPTPWTELKYWYRPRSPSRVDRRSSPRLRTAPFLWQRIFPGVIFTFN